MTRPEWKRLRLARFLVLEALLMAVFVGCCWWLFTRAATVPEPEVLTVIREVPVEVTVAPAERSRPESPLTDAETDALLEACEAGHIDPAVALGLIQIESSFRPDALNKRSGCYGYCQLNPKYFPSGLTPEENIRTGIDYLAERVDRYEDLEAGLCAYHAGYDTGDRVYSAKVLAAAEGWEAEA